MGVEEGELLPTVELPLEVPEELLPVVEELLEVSIKAPLPLG